SVKLLKGFAGTAVRVFWLIHVALESRGMEPRLSINRSYFGDSDGLLPSVAQPPLPLQEFLPLQLLSAVLQPPLPLHEFMPLQACLSVASLSLSPILSETPAFKLVWSACALTASEQRIKPAISAPAIIAFFI